MAGSFCQINPMLDEVWMRMVLRQLNAEMGSLPAPAVKRALRATFDYCGRRLPIPYGQKGHVAFPREFARTCIRSELARLRVQ